MPALQILNFVKPALGMPAMPLVPSRTLNFSNSMLTSDFLFSVN